jgi:hypothetical protein
MSIISPRQSFPRSTCAGDSTADVPAKGGAHNTRVELLCELRELDFVYCQNRLKLAAGHLKGFLSADREWLIEKTAAKVLVCQ